MSRTYTQKDLEERFAWMRKPQKLKCEIAAGSEAPARPLAAAKSGGARGCPRQRSVGTWIK
jgi:hypothetical protein